MKNIDTDIFKKLENIDLTNISKTSSPERKITQQNTSTSAKKHSEVDEKLQSPKPDTENIVKNELKSDEIIKSMVSERQQLIEQYLDDKLKSRQSVRETDKLVIDEKQLEELKNDLKIELNNDLNFHLDGIKEYLRDELENRTKDFNIMRRNNVDEVLKDLEARKQPAKGEIERAVIKIISNKLERSLSAPSRLTVKSNYNIITSGFEQTRNELSIAATKADMVKPIYNDFKPLFEEDNMKVNDFVKMSTKSAKNIKVQGLVPTKSRDKSFQQGLNTTLSKDLTKATINPSLA